MRVQPGNEPSFVAKMKAGLARTYLLIPGVRVMVKYEISKKDHVTLDDANQAILERTPLLRKI